MVQEFDLIVIGAGTGGNGVARMAAAAGWKVASVDCLPYGGTCALRGCDPKKMLIAVTEGVEWAHNMKGKGLEAQVSVNWPDMIAFKRTFTDVMPPRIETGLEKAGVTTLRAERLGQTAIASRESLKKYRQASCCQAFCALPRPLMAPRIEHCSRPPSPGQTAMRSSSSSRMRRRPSILVWTFARFARARALTARHPASGTFRKARSSAISPSENPRSFAPEMNFSLLTVSPP